MSGQLNQIALDPARSVVVEAVAGSGKTWLLVSRVIRLLLDGVKPSEILAITFTRKAAQEMAERLREGLRVLAVADEREARDFLAQREVPESAAGDTLKRARGLYEQFLTAQPPITIATFHSWFLQLLRRAPLEAGALGDVALVEQTGGLIDEAWQRFGSRIQREPGSPLAESLDWLFRNYGLASTRKLLRNFLLRRGEWWAYTRGQDDPVAWSLQRIAAGMDVDPGADVAMMALGDAALKADLGELVALLARNTASDLRLVEAYDAALRGLDAESWLDAACNLLLKVDGTQRSRKKNTAQGKRLGATDEARMIELDQVLGARLETICRHRADQVCYRVNEAALACGIALVEEYQALKSERQAIDYGDIEWNAYNLVSVSEHAIYMHHKLDSRYRHILLDEFQDTNPLQWLTLKSWFAAAAEADARPIVFLVGDPKQSIYRFRRAEARLFDQAASYLQTEFDALKVPQQASRRCAPAIIDVVNRLFSAEPDFTGYAPHTAHYAAKPGRVEVLPLVARSAGKSGSEPDPASHEFDSDYRELRNPLERAREIDEDLRRATEAQQIVDRILEIVGVWHVNDDKAVSTVSNTRPARYRDIMLLVKKRTHLEIYEHALRAAGIPFVTSRQGGLLRTLEAQDMVALLEFMVSPFADLQLAHVLRSPVFNCSDDDLMALARVGGGTWWERLGRVALDAQASAALRRAHALLARWLVQSDVLPVHDQLDRIYFEGDLAKRYAAAVPPAMRGSVLANLHAFMQRALDTDAGRYPSLPRFLHELIDLTEAPTDEAPDEGVVGDAGDALRIHTIHGAKGLEAPIAWLLDAGAGREPGEAYEVMIDWPPEAQAPAHFSVCTRKAEQGSIQRELAAAEERLARREELNLLYVAMTRAQQVLFVSGCEGQGREGSWYEKVRAAVRAAAGHELTRDDLAAAAHHGSALATPQQKILDFEAAPLDESGAHAAAIDPRLTQPLPTGIRRPALTTRGQRYGTHFHRLMERLTLLPAGGKSHATPQDRSLIQRELGLADRDFDAMWDSAQRLLAESALTRFFDAGRYVRATNEVPFVTAAGELRRIDRLVEFDDEVWVLDYKTGELPGDAALLSRYETQLDSYRKAVSAIAPGKRVQAMLVFANGVHRVLPLTAAV